MRVIIDTNVFVSGIYFSGPPYHILKAWRDGKLQLVLSPEILDEYKEVAEALAEQFPSINLGPILELVAIKTEMYPAKNLPNQVSTDPDDDKFLACALASNCKMIISGDKHLLRVSGYQEIRVLKPREFLDEYLV